MGNNNQRLKGNLHNSRRNYGYNNYKNAQNDEVNSDDEKNNEKNFKISEYDKELSQMLFNEENNRRNESTDCRTVPPNSESTVGGSAR